MLEERDKKMSNQTEPTVPTTEQPVEKTQEQLDTERFTSVMALLSVGKIADVSTDDFGFLATYKKRLDNRPLFDEIQSIRNQIKSLGETLVEKTRTYQEKTGLSLSSVRTTQGTSRMGIVKNPERMNYIEELIREGKHSRDDITKLVESRFPNSESTVKTKLSDSCNPDYSPFEYLAHIVNGVLSFTTTKVDKEYQKKQKELREASRKAGK